MFKPSATVHKSPSGTLKVLVCSEDAGKCLDAYKACEDPGELVFIRKGHVDKIKKIEDPKAIKARQLESEKIAEEKSKAAESEKKAKIDKLKAEIADLEGVAKKTAKKTTVKS